MKESKFNVQSSGSVISNVYSMGFDSCYHNVAYHNVAPAGLAEQSDLTVFYHNVAPAGLAKQW